MKVISPITSRNTSTNLPSKLKSHKREPETSQCMMLVGTQKTIRILLMLPHLKPLNMQTFQKNNRFQVIEFKNSSMLLKLKSFKRSEKVALAA